MGFQFRMEKAQDGFTLLMATKEKGSLSNLWKNIEIERFVSSMSIRGGIFQTGLFVIDHKQDALNNVMRDINEALTEDQQRYLRDGLSKIRRNGVARELWKSGVFILL